MYTAAIDYIHSIILYVYCIVTGVTIMSIILLCTMYISDNDNMINTICVHVRLFFLIQTTSQNNVNIQNIFDFYKKCCLFTNI